MSGTTSSHYASVTASELLALYLESARLEEATELANRIGDTHDPHLLLILSRCALANGDPQKQEMYLEQAVENSYLPVELVKS